MALNIPALSTVRQFVFRPAPQPIAPTPAALDWSAIEALIDTTDGQKAQIALRKWAGENGWTCDLLDVGSREFSAAAWFASLYQAEAVLAIDPTSEQAAKWETGGAEAYWLRWRAAYANRQIATICLCFIRTRARREAVKS